ncbi:hypothetical protein, partial [Streptomyces sp. SP17BM10]|uniref:hypothetical protein n=1 Tax=Streptomyces sp. SP17BM10 TaxID=3002530 RepID=UPI003FCEAD4D
MVGLFINTLPVRVALDPAERFGARLERLQDLQAGDMDHLYLPLADRQRIAGLGAHFVPLVVCGLFWEVGADRGPVALVVVMGFVFVMVFLVAKFGELFGGGGLP